MIQNNDTDTVWGFIFHSIKTTVNTPTILITTGRNTSTNRNDSSNKQNGNNPYSYEETILRVQVSTIILINVTIALILLRRNLRVINSNKLFLNLQVTHIIISLSVVIFGIDPIKVTLVLNKAILMAMFICLMMVTIDRLVILKYPFIYQNLKTTHYLTIIIISWVFPVLYFFVGLNINITQSQYLVVSIVLIATAAITLTISNIMVYSIVRRHLHMIRRNTVEVYDNTDKKKQTLKVVKSTYVCFAVVISFVLLWFPFLIHDILTLENIYTPNYGKTFTFVVEVFALCNSGLDPIIYAILNKKVKREVLLVIGKYGLLKRKEKHSTRESKTSVV